MKVCTGCRAAKPLDEFYRRAKSADGRDTRCKTCMDARWSSYYAENSAQMIARKIERHKERYAEDSAYHRRNHLRAKFRMTLEEYEAKLASQGGCCAICAATTPGGKWGPSGRLHVDHDHDCCPGTKTCGACIRDLLCNGCNNGTGIVDKPDLLRKRADYVEYWRAIRLGRLQEPCPPRT
jgi:hypothetical protein